MGDMPGALTREGFVLLATTTGPIIGALLVIGLCVGIFQAATQINDPAVGFLPRMVTGMLVAYFTGPWVLEKLSHYLAAAFRGMSGHM